MRELFLLRERHNSVFASVLSEHETIPWRPLTIGEFLDIQTRFSHGAYPHAALEDEVFKRCVLSPILVENIGKLPAGTVSAVAQAILAHSGPVALQDIENRLEFCRHEASAVVHDMMALITQAFPAYTPEQVYALEYDTFMLRLAQAERKLMQIGVLQKPISFTDQQGQQKPPRIEKLPPPEELERAWRQQQTEKQPSRIRSRSDQLIITDSDRQEQLAARSGHEAMDAVLLEKQAMDDVPNVYKEYLEQMKKGETVRIMTPEERVEAANARAKKSEQEFRLLVQEEKGRIAELEKRVSKVKPKKSRRRRTKSK